HGRYGHGAVTAGPRYLCLAHGGLRQSCRDGGQRHVASRWPSPLVPERSFSLRWIWRWRSIAGQVLELDRLVTVARSDSSAEDPAPVAADALARRRALGWRGVLAAHETAWQQRWDASDIIIEGDDEVQEAACFAVYHLTSAANPEDERVSVGARGLTGDAYFGHVFWDTEIYLLPFYVTIWPEAARALLMYRYHTLQRAPRQTRWVTKARSTPGNRPTPARRPRPSAWWVPP